MLSRKNLETGHVGIIMGESSDSSDSEMISLRITWRPCSFCVPWDYDACRRNILCNDAAGYDDAQIRGRTAYCCKDLVRPLKCPLQDRIIALAQAFVSSS